MAVFRFGGLAASFGGVTWHDHKAVESSASHWSGSGRRNSGRGRVAMVACLSGEGGRKNSGVQRGKSPQLALTVLNVRQQVTQEHPNSWGLLWGPGSIESKHRDAGADLFQGQQGILKNLVGGNGGSEGVNRSDGDCSQYSHRHPPVTMQDPHNGQNPVQQARMSGSDQFPSGTPDHHRWCRKGKRVET